MLMPVIALIHSSGNDDAVDFELGLRNLKCGRREAYGERGRAARLRKTDLRDFLSLRNFYPFEQHS
jgi:hypothetical protein